MWKVFRPNKHGFEGGKIRGQTFCLDLKKVESTQMKKNILESPERLIKSSIINTRPLF